MTAVSTGAGVVEVDYHQGYLTTPTEIPELGDVPSTGIIDAGRDGGAQFHTGVSLGGVRYTWALHDSEPPPDLEPWQDVAQVHVLAPDGELHVAGWGGASFDETNLASAGPGTYVVRFSTRGRDLQWDEVVETALEEFHLDVWPAAAGDSSPQVLKALSKAAQSSAD